VNPEGLKVTPKFSVSVAPLVLAELSEFVLHTPLPTATWNVLLLGS
jgi:hypothetical protein